MSAQSAPGGSPAPQAGGVIAGRVLNANGRYVGNARVRIDGAAVEVFTDDFGRFSLPVTAGPVHLRIVYTGQRDTVTTVTVPPGQTVRPEIVLGQTGEAGAAAVIRLDPYVISAQKHLDAAALAANEQRFAPNLKNVISSDAFADVGDGNLGELAKYLPGVSVGNLGVDAVDISVRGLPPAMTSVSTDGSRMASANSSLIGRTFQLEQVSINNVSRIELIKTPTPDVPADTLGGSVNLVSKRAFERSTAQFDWRLFAGTRDNLPRTLGHTHHTSREPTTLLRPSFDFTWTVPLSERLGFAINGLHSNAPVRIQRQATNWLPDHLGRVAGYTVPANNDPYLARFVINNGAKFTQRSSVGATLDYKLSTRDELSFAYQYNYYAATFNDHNINYDVGRGVTAWARDFVQGGAGNGSVFFGARQYGLKRGGTWMPALNYRHRGSAWQGNASASYSNGTNSYRNIERGFFENIIVRMVGPLTLRYEDVGRDGPRRIIVRDAAGRILDPSQLANYRVESTTGTQRQSTDTLAAARADVQRTFDFRAPFSLKAGVDVRRNRRDIRRHPGAWTFVGADGVANTADDNAGGFIDDGFSRNPPAYHHPAIEYPSYHKLYDRFVANPGHFRADPAADHRTSVNFSQAITETISAAFLRGDLKLLGSRLWLVGGVRFERTADRGEGARVDNNAIFQRDSRGQLVRNAAGQLVPVTADPLAQARLTHIDRGARSGTGYEGFYPSLNATYHATDNFQLRLAYARTLGRPDYGNIVPGVTLPAGAATNIVVQNPALKPWSADNFDAAAEYYFEQGGQFTAGVFRKKISDFFGQITTVATAEQLRLYDLDPNLYQDFTLTLPINVGAARIDGYEIGYRQPLRFLPAWARGVEVFCNVTKLVVAGDRAADFSGFTPTTIAFGGSFTRPKYTLHVNTLHTGRSPGTLLAGTQPPGTYNYTPPLTVVDVNAEYRVTRRIGLFCNVRNVGGAEESGERYAATTPGYSRKMTGAYNARVVTLGLKGRF